MNTLAIFASGSGTNAEQIMQYFKNHPAIRVNLVLSNKSDAAVLARAARYKVPSLVFTRNDFYESDLIINALKEHDVTFIILAGFLWLVPQNILSSYPGKIINIHPALLPKYGGKGMYGERVHNAIIANKDKESGITIHYVNQEYDKGDIIFQARCDVNPEDTPGQLAEKIHALEHRYFPQIIEKTVLGEKFSEPKTNSFK